MRSVWLALGLAGLEVTQAAAQQPLSGAFITRLGRDTVLLERFTLGPDRLQGTIVSLAPRVRVVTYTATIRRDGQITGFEVTNRPGLEGGQPPVQWRAALVDSQLTLVSQRANGAVDTSSFTVGAVSTPFIQLSLGLYQALLRRVAPMSRDSVPLNMYSFGVRQPTATFVARRGRDTVAFGYFGDPMYVAVDRDGKVVGLNGMRTTQKFLAEPAPGLDLERVTADFVARERAGVVAGTPSPRDTARATVAGATLWVDYGRPAVRGRRILGEVVPYGQVWRTGANAATQLSTSADLVLGALTIPAGLYTLWTLPSPGGATLIVNRQTGQWGTIYDPARDLGRVPLTSGAPAEPAERFTITIVTGDGRNGELRFDWDRTRWTIPFSVK